MLKNFSPRQLSDEEYLCFKNALNVLAREQKEFTLEDFRIGVQEDDEVRDVLRIINNKKLNKLLGDPEHDEETPGLLYPAITYTKNVKKAISDEISLKLEKYISSFWQEELSGSSLNYLKFEAQKEFLEDEILASHYKKYGDSFQLEVFLNNKFQQEDRQDFLIIQTIDTLVYLEYIEVETIQMNIKPTSLDNQSILFKIKIFGKYISSLNKGKDVAGFVAYNSFEENGKYYFQSGDDTLPLDGKKEVWQFLRLFNDNKSSVSRDLLMKLVENKTNFDNRMAGAKTKLEDIGLIINHEKDGAKITYRIKRE